MNTGAVNTDKISFKYDGNNVLSDVSFRLEDGEFVILFGPNGSGKTTLVRLIAKLINPTGGRIELFGKNIADMPAGKIPRFVSYVPQIVKTARDIPVYVKDVIGFGYYAKYGWFNRDKISRDEQIDFYADKLGIRHLLNKPAGRLSGGEIKKMHLARVLVQGARIMLLDEPTAHLDMKSKKDFYKEMKSVYDELKITVLLIVHSMEDIPGFSRRMIFLSEGKISADGTVQEVVNGHIC